MHRVRLPEFIDQRLQFFLDCFEERRLPVVDDGRVGFHVNQREHPLGHADALAVEVHDLVGDRLEVLDQAHLILLEHERGRVFVHDEDRCHRGVSLAEHSRVLHDLIAKVHWGEGLVGKVKDRFLFEVMQQNVVEYEQ